MRHTLIATGLCLLLSLPTAVAAQPVQKQSTNAIWFENWNGLTQATMRIATPDGDIRDVASDRGTPVFELSGGKIVDGVYRYELRAATTEMVKNRDYNKDSVIGNDSEYLPKPLYITGKFVVDRGVIIRPKDIEEETEG
jgi:hypothetical protein